jgi:peptidoglycan/LPS O-acetylase OafA/YrhL
MNNDKQRLDYLDGVRAFAALWIVLGHCHLFALGWNRSAGLIGKPLDLLMYMHMAVNIFLVLSGFCLALPVARNGYRLTTSAGYYLQARAARILPPYYAVLFLILIVNFFVPLASWARQEAGMTYEVPASVLWTNLLLMQDALPRYNQINGPFWSIATEWHIYFVFPLIVLSLRRLGEWKTLALGGIAAVLLTKAESTYGEWSPAFPIKVPIPPYYIFLFVLGVVAACLAFGERYQDHRQKIGKAAWLTAGVISIPYFYAMWRYRILDGTNAHVLPEHYHIVDPLCGAVAAAVLLGLSRLAPANFLRRFFECRPLVRLGHFSYSLYLIHLPIVAAFYHWMQVKGWAAGSPNLQFALLVVCGGGISLAAAWCTAQVFEKYATRALLKNAATSKLEQAPAA